VRVDLIFFKRMDDNFPVVSRPVAASGDTDYTLSLDEVSQRYANAGHPRTLRTLQRYCASGHLEAQKVATAIGDKYLVTPQSVARHIAQIQELASLTPVALSRVEPRPAAAHDAPIQSHDSSPTNHASGSDAARPGATSDGLSRYVERLEREVEQGKDEREFLREQIDRKDKTIDSLIERDRETNILVRGLQEMLTPLLGPWREQKPEHDQPGI
jgi:hypothetical protein